MTVFTKTKNWGFSCKKDGCKDSFLGVYRSIREISSRYTWWKPS